MIRYADPEVCPCCRMQIPYAASQCTRCGAVLTGPVAQALFRTLTQADALVAQLTAPAPASVGVGVPVSVPAPATGPVDTGRVDPTYPSFPAPAPTDRRSGLSAASVPRILLGLGATCLLVAAVVFLAVAWSDLGMGARTAILLALTAGAAAATGWMGRRGLPAGAEAFGLVFLGFLTLDVFGAQDAGWFGGLGDDGFTVLLGSVLAVAAVGTAVGVTRTGMRPLVGAQLVVAAAAMTVAAGVTMMTGGQNAAVLVAIVLGAAALAHAVHLLHLKVAAVATGAVAGLWWLVLVGLGIDRVGSEPTLAGVWADLGGWPLLAAAALAAAPSLLRSLPLPVRVTGASVGVALLTVVAVAPAADESPAPWSSSGSSSSPPVPPSRWSPPAPGAGSRSCRPSPPASRSPPRSRSWAARRSRPSSTTGSGRSTPGSTCSPRPSRATGRCSSR